MHMHMQFKAIATKQSRYSSVGFEAPGVEGNEKADNLAKDTVKQIAFY